MAWTVGSGSYREVRFHVLVGNGNAPAYFARAVNLGVVPCAGGDLPQTFANRRKVHVRRRCVPPCCCAEEGV